MASHTASLLHPVLFLALFTQPTASVLTKAFGPQTAFVELSKELDSGSLGIDYLTSERIGGEVKEESSSSACPWPARLSL